MNTILLNRGVIVYLSSEIVLWGIFAIAFVVMVSILYGWDFDKYTQKQYILQKRAWLTVTILSFVSIFKFLLLPYFVYTIDSLKDIVPGAMCAAGVISANSYGLKLLLLKILILFGFTLWIILNRYDLNAKNYPLFKIKSWFFILLFVALTVELWLDIEYFLHIDINIPVSCCSALFGQLEGANPLPFGLNTNTMLLLFYILYILSMLLLFSSEAWLILIVIPLFGVISYYSVVYFFGTYIYELPTHKCPFCMLQKDYYYIGYLIWSSLFGAVYLSLSGAILQLLTKSNSKSLYQWSMKLFTLFVAVCSLYVITYYIRSGVLL